jgi:hypothetical protein
MDSKKFGRVSAYLALATGVALLAWQGWRIIATNYDVGYLPTSPSMSFLYVVNLAFIAGLLVGALRTLRKQSGGLRLLAGAWGAEAGVASLQFYLQLTLLESVEGNALLSTPSGAADFFGAGAIFVLAVLGLALAVLHKEG